MPNNLDLQWDHVINAATCLRICTNLEMQIPKLRLSIWWWLEALDILSPWPSSWLLNSHSWDTDLMRMLIPSLVQGLLEVKVDLTYTRRSIRIRSLHLVDFLNVEDHQLLRVNNRILVIELLLLMKFTALSNWVEVRHLRNPASGRINFDNLIRNRPIPQVLRPLLALTRVLLKHSLISLIFHILQILFNIHIINIRQPCVVRQPFISLALSMERATLPSQLVNRAHILVVTMTLQLH